MTIRDDINLMEAFIGPKQRAFGQKYDPTAGHDPATLKHAKHAKQYPTAAAYAHEMNPIKATGYDPDHVKARDKRESDKHAGNWETWKGQGLLDIDETEVDEAAPMWKNMSLAQLKQEVLDHLDHVLSCQSCRKVEKVSALREIAAAAKRMADGIEDQQRQRDRMEQDRLSRGHAPLTRE
jgi:hypothetical protein